MPQLFFVGGRDPLCPTDTLRSITEDLTGPTRIHVIENGGHSFEPPEEDPAALDRAFDLIVNQTMDWIQALYR